MTTKLLIFYSTLKLKTMTKISLFLVSAVFAFACSSSSAQVTQERKVSGFSSVDVSEGIKVTLTIGDKESVVVTAPEDYIDNVVTEVSGSELDIYIKGNNVVNKGRNVEVMVTAKFIDRIESSSGSSLTSTNSINAEELRVSVSSGAKVDIEVEAKRVAVDASSGAGAKLRGITTNLSTEASSGSHISAGELKAQNVIADVSSGANIKVHAEKKINADASSGGSVGYSGSPQMVDVDKSSGGSVHRK